ncbi:hypothetical protein BC941DRAFT_466314 [Chlamydoabsidia padenii]|nr:hypothetical protein BC941DRAFT_466314 [Chlamydoabsidia padenii]
MSKETKRRLSYNENSDNITSTSSQTNIKRSKIQHQNIIPELSLATLSINENPLIQITGDYSAINQYLRQIHIERFGDPELNERWWERDSKSQDKMDEG